VKEAEVKRSGGRRTNVRSIRLSLPPPSQTRRTPRATDGACGSGNPSITVPVAWDTDNGGEGVGGWITSNAGGVIGGEVAVAEMERVVGVGVEVTDEAEESEVVRRGMSGSGAAESFEKREKEESVVIEKQ
jgi:hypothetical protein